MGLIFPRANARMTEQRKAAIRSRLFQELQQRFIAEGCPIDEANARALAKMKSGKLTCS